MLDVFTKFVQLCPINMPQFPVSGIELGCTALCNSAANLVKWFMRELKRWLSIYCNEHHSKWAVIVNYVQLIN
ncbi:hypothetical protein PR048_013216 [Dryococelus australis]|uniref:Uncharacterized protein n=1 Tax=Dryococelus australis TaxID=614101 RepID=A0ABQ9HS05_9NEOP|nr:hypothetical protein PR048_013216 [Dryococelus australis]